MSDPLEKIVAPWTEEQVQTLNKWQTLPNMHPFTGYNSAGNKVSLIATLEGWIAEEGGQVVQTWAYASMASKEMIERLRQEYEELMKLLTGTSKKGKK